MIDIVQKLPVGWSVIEAEDQWIVYDQHDELICKASPPERLNKLLDVEFQIAQTFVSVMHAIKNIEPAEA